MRRTVDLFDATVEVLCALQPLRVTPETPVFVNTNGGPNRAELAAAHWYRCLRAGGIRVRSLYSTKDTS